MIRCYCDPPTVDAGGTLSVFVSTDAAHFVLRVYRQTTGFRHVASVPEYEAEGEFVGEGTVDQDWGWPEYRLALPASLASGAYFVVAAEVTAGGARRWPSLQDAAGDWGKALFVVAPVDRQHKPILYKLSWFTYACYNWTGEGSLYAGAHWSDYRNRPGYRVSWRRPGVATGGLVSEGDPHDVYVPGSRRQTFEHWDAPFFRFLHREGFEFDVATDLDVHRRPELLRQYNLVLSVGHDEYWSDELRDAIDDYISNGGNLAFLSGNTCCFRIDVEETTATIRCEKARGHEAEYLWQARRPEQETTGVTYFNGGGWWDGRRPQVGYRPYHHAHWSYDGVDTSTDLGASTSPPVVGYECDGADYGMQRGRPVVTRASFGRLPIVLGVGPLGEGWHAFKRGAAATIVTYTDRSGGIVYTGATTDWPIVAETDPEIGKVTSNVLRALQRPNLRVLGPFREGRSTDLVQAGKSYEFRLQSTPGRPAPGTVTAWRVAIDDKVLLDWVGSGPVLRFEVPEDARTLTVSVDQRVHEGAHCGFGSLSFDVLNTTEAATVGFTRALGRAGTPGGPPGSFTDVERAWPVNRSPISSTQAGVLSAALKQMTESLRQLGETGDQGPL